MGGDSSAGRLAAFRSLAGNRALARVVGGYALFILTEYSVWVTMLVFAYSRGGATIAGLVAVAQLVPAAVLAPVAAAVADRRSPVVLLAGGLPGAGGGDGRDRRGGHRRRASGSVRVRRRRFRRGDHDPPGAVDRPVFGVLEGLTMAGLALGSLLVPVLVYLGGSRPALLGVAAVLPLAAAVGGRGLFGLDAEAPVPVVEIALLRSLPLFAELPGPAIEGLAAALTPVDVSAGAVLIREGDQGDAYYAIAAGELDAVADGRFLRRCLAMPPPSGRRAVSPTRG